MHVIYCNGGAPFISLPIEGLFSKTAKIRFDTKIKSDPEIRFESKIKSDPKSRLRTKIKYVLKIRFHTKNLNAF